MRFNFQQGPPFKCNLQCEQCTAVTSKGTRCKRQVCIGKPVCSLHRKDLQVKKSSIPNSGKGLFAKRDYKKNEVIGQYTGERLTAKQLQDRYGYSTAPYALQVGSMIIDAACSRGIMSLANAKKQKANTNAKLVNKSTSAGVNVRATRKIKKGKEIFLHYGNDYWKSVHGIHSTK